MQHVEVPQDRIDVLVGKSDSTLRGIGSRAEIRLDVDSENDSVVIDSVGDPVLGIAAPDMVRAVGRGFVPEGAMALLDDDIMMFEPVDIDRHTRNKNDMRRQRGRLVGESGCTCELIGELMGVGVVIYDTTLGIIGQPEEAEVVHRTVEMILNGAPHGAVYSSLKRKHDELTQGLNIRQNN